MALNDRQSVEWLVSDAIKTTNVNETCSSRCLFPIRKCYKIYCNKSQHETKRIIYIYMIALNDTKSVEWVSSYGNKKNEYK